MTEEIINYSVKEGESEISGQVTMKMPETVEEAVRMWGEDVVLAKCLQAVRVDAQRICRAAGSAEEAQKAIDNWTPGVPRRVAGAGGTSLSALIKQLKSLPPDKKAEVEAMLKSLFQG